MSAATVILGQIFGKMHFVLYHELSRYYKNTILCAIWEEGLDNLLALPVASF
jgi:hypothetical protein